MLKDEQKAAGKRKGSIHKKTQMAIYIKSAEDDLLLFLANDKLRIFNISGSTA